MHLDISTEALRRQSDSFPKFSSAFLNCKALCRDNKPVDQRPGTGKNVQMEHVFSVISIWNFPMAKTRQPFQSSCLCRKFSTGKNQNSVCKWLKNNLLKVMTWLLKKICQAFLNLFHVLYINWHFLLSEYRFWYVLRYVYARPKVIRRL